MRIIYYKYDKHYRYDLKIGTAKNLEEKARIPSKAVTFLFLQRCSQLNLTKIYNLFARTMTFHIYRSLSFVSKATDLEDCENLSSLPIKLFFP